MSGVNIAGTLQRINIFMKAGIVQILLQHQPPVYHIIVQNIFLTLHPTCQTLSRTLPVLYSHLLTT